MKAEDDKLDINKLINVLTSLKIFFKKVDDLDVHKLKSLPSDVVDNEAVKNTNKQNSEKKIGDVNKKIPDTNGFVTTNVLNTKISEV